MAKPLTSWLVPSFSQHNLRLVVSERCLDVSVTKFWHKFASLRQVNTPSSWDKFQNCCTDMYLIRFLPNFAVFYVFLWISRDFADLPEFRGSATARNIRSPAWSRLKKNWGYNCSFSKMSTFALKRLVSWSNNIQSLQQRLYTQNKAKEETRKLCCISRGSIRVVILTYTPLVFKLPCFIKLIFCNFFLFIYFIFFPMLFFTHNVYPHQWARTSTHDPRHLAILIPMLS